METGDKYLTAADRAGLVEQRRKELIRLAKMEANFPENNFYWLDDFFMFQPSFAPDPQMGLETYEDLMKRDEQREKDGFPRKLKVGKLPAPGRSGKIILVPYTEEEKLVHDEFEPGSSGGGAGQGEGEEGEVIGEQPVEPEQGEGDEGEAGEGSGGEHGIDAEAYEIGRELIEKFDLPNLEDKGKKVAMNEYVYDLTDIFRGAGQFLDKKRTLLKIVETNIGLKRIKRGSVDTTNLVIGNKDKVYRVLSRERVYRSQAVVFFLRDYSGSMTGDPTKAVVSQHLMIYAWLMAQYQELVIPRFILHDSEAKEVPDFNAYFRSKVAGGTMVASAYRKVVEIVEEEGLERDYNIYVFHGTDGDDWDKDGEEAIPEVKKILSFVNRMGVTIAKSAWGGDKETEVEKYFNASGLLESAKDKLRLFHLIAREANDEILIEGIKHLVSK